MPEQKPEATVWLALPVSPGCALGPVRLLNRARCGPFPTMITATQLATEQSQLQTALALASDELDELHRQMTLTLGTAEAEIFTAQKLFLHDPELMEMVEQLMTAQHLSAAAAWQQAIEEQSAALAALRDSTLAARAADVRDLGHRVLQHLQGAPGESPQERSGEQPAIIVARDLTPSQTAELDPALILGICTVEGGPTTHAAIIARALEIPAVSGLDATAFDTLQAGQELAIDGTHGLVYPRPQGDERARLQTTMLSEQRARLRRRERSGVYWRNRPGSTADGQRVPVYANVGDAAGALEAAQHGAEGIGLLRTEFLFGQRAVFPDEQEQLAVYVEVFRAFANHALFQKTIVTRTLDAGADKPFPALEPLLGKWKETNPALGLRGARIHLLHQDLLSQQLRALLQAAGLTGIHLHIMFPMIATVEETRTLKLVLAKCREELLSAGLAIPQDIRVGIMIETPSAVWMADALAREVDFFSLGANDLFQYTLAADRTNSRVMGLFGSLEPALWRSIAHVVQAGRVGGCAIAVCGELAADPRYGPLLAGLGVQELSVSPPALARVKEALGQRSLADWQTMARTLLHATTAAEIDGLLTMS
jgi:phosphoenolpyruvate-protein phosphotransferase